MQKCIVLLCVCEAFLWGGQVVTTQQAELARAPRFSTVPTRLLFPFASTRDGFETEITISNTSLDTFGTAPINGACRLHFHGAGAPPASTPQSIAAGKQLVFRLSEGADGIPAAPGFEGYVIGECDFPLARGTAKLYAAGRQGVSLDAQVLMFPMNGSPQQSLLFPFISNQGGLDSGIVIANTSTDPFGHTRSSGSCGLYFYGLNAPPVFTTPMIPAGAIYRISTAAIAPGFQGYVIAACGFGRASGTAFVGDAGGRETAFSETAELLSTPRRVTARALLFSSVSNENGVDTRIAIANTGSDPFGTTGAAAACTLSFYGNNAPGPVSTGTIPSGSTYSSAISVIAPGFDGYVVGDCSFPHARGWAFTNATAAGSDGGSETAEVVVTPRSTKPASLLFTGVSSRDGADTRIVVANTSQDPFGTSQSAGACTVSYVGDSEEGGTIPPSTSTLIQPGSQLIFSLREGNPAQGIRPAPGFRGYVIADCTFPLARGIATSTVNAPSLTIRAPHSAELAEGLTNATYTVMVSNAAGAGPTGGPVTVMDTVPGGGNLISMAGVGWTCSAGASACTRSDSLAGGSSYPPIIVTAEVPVHVTSPQVNWISVAGGGSLTANGTHTIVIRRKSALLSNTNSVTVGSVKRQAVAPAASAVELRFVPIAPCRVADTRDANGPFGGPQLAGGVARTFAIASSACGVPASALAYSLNVAVVPAGPLGYLTLWPAGDVQPVVSTLNSLDGRVKSNAAIVPAGALGAISAFASNPTHLVLDINGYFVPATDTSALAFYPIAPCRVADTRGPTAQLGGPSLAGGQVRTFPVLSASSCNIPATAQAYSLNLAAVPTGPLGYVTAWAAGQAKPDAASLNALTGTVTANAAIVRAGTGGAINVVASNATNLVIDINGYFAPYTTGGLSLYNVSPCRVLDTRLPSGTPPITATVKNVNVLLSGCGAPSTAQAFVLSATVVPPAPLGYLTLWAQGQTQPVVSTLNALDAAVTSNLALVPATNGSIGAFPSNPTHLILDVFGYFAPPPIPTTAQITVSNAAVGQNLQAPITITFSPPPASDVTLTITSSNGTLTKLGSPDVLGTTQIQATIPALTGSVSTYAKAFASSGSVSITASAPGYTTGTGTVTLGRSGFVLSGPNGIGASFTTYEGVPTQLTVYAARIDAAGQFAESQQTRGTYGVSVPISSSATTVGTLSTSSVGFTGAMESATVQFNASPTNTGSTTVSLAAPPALPASGYSMAITVQPSGLVPFSVTVGKNLQTSTSISLSGRPLSPVVVTLHSNDQTRLKFANSPTGTPSDTINVTIPANQMTSSTFYVLGFDGTGTAGYTATAASYGTLNSTVTLAPSGLVIESPAGPGADFTMSLGIGNATLYVRSARLNGAGTPVEYQAVASGLSASVVVGSNPTTVGTITTSPIAIGGGSDSASTEFHAVANGSAAITASSGGFATDSINVTVQPPTLVVAGGFTIGQHLQQDNLLILPVPAPVGGVDVTLHSTSPSLAISGSATAAGSATITLHLAAGAQFATYYLQGLGSSGSASYTATAAGYSQGNGTVDLAPSSVVIVGPSTIPLSGGPQPLSVISAFLDATGGPANNGQQALAGGPPLVVTLHNTNSAKGTVPPTVTIAPGTSVMPAMFTPLAVGSTSVSVDQPPGWTTPSSLTQVNITVQ